MAELDLSNATTTNIDVPDFIVEAKALDVDNDDGETIWYFSDARQNMGYYSEIPEINSAANTLATWAFSKGVDYEDENTKQEFEHVSGRGNDTFQTLMWNHEVVKLVVGDAFMEIVWEDDDETKALANLIPISPERVRIISKDGRILRYEVWNSSTSTWKIIKTTHMYHSSNKRIGDQVHGTSQVDAVKWIIDARNEALITNRMIEIRGRALGIVEFTTNNQGKIEFANKAIEKAVRTGNMLGYSKGTMEIKDFPQKSLAERMEWIRYLETFFYQVFGVPRSIATSDGTSEVGGINGHLIFEPIYGKEQTDEEANIWNQMFRILTFNRPPSLAPKVQENQAANTGTTTIPPEEATPSVNR